MNRIYRPTGESCPAGFVTGDELTHTDQQADDGISQYRDATLDLGEVVYNQGEERAARAIDQVIRIGLPQFDLN